MKIERLTLERYGGFSDRKLVFRPDAALHVVLGANESGKTTALSAIGDLLFGFGHQTAYDFLHDGKALRIGAELRLADGRALSFRRRKGTKNTLVDVNDQPLPDDLLAPLIGNLTRETFRTEFGLTAQALRDGGHELLKAGGRLAETLAASSAGLTALSNLRETLSREADDLFTPRKSAGKAFYIAAERYDRAENGLRAAIVTADALQAAEAEVETAKAHVAALTGEHETAGRDLARFQRCVRTRPKLARLENLTRDLEAYADLPKLPVQTVEDWRAALRADLKAAEDLRKLDTGDEEDSAAIAALAVDENVLSCAALIDALRERIGAVRKAIDDLPRRHEARRHAQAELDELARRLGLASHHALLEKRPADLALARVRELVDDGKRTAERRREAEERHHKAMLDHAQLASEAGSSIHAVDPAIFRQRLEAVVDVPADADRLRREIAECDADGRDLANAAAVLNPAALDPDRLSTLPLPDEAEIAKHARAADEITEGERKTRVELATAERAINDSNTQIERLTRDGISATKAGLLTVRADRDAGFETLRIALDGDAASRGERFVEVRSLSRIVDDVTDWLLIDTERAALKQAAEERLADSCKQRDAAIAALTAMASRRTEYGSAWQGLWASNGIVPRSPAEMMRWRERVVAIVDGRSRLLRRRTSASALAASLDGCRAALVKLMQDHGRKPDATLPADVLYREANNWLNELQKAWTTAREHDVARKGAEREVTESDAAVARVMELIATHAAAWPMAVAAIGLAARASLAEAESAVAVWQSVAVPKQSLERESRSVEGIEADMAAFDADVASAVTKAAPDLAGGEAQGMLARLTALLADARRDAESRARLRQAITRRHSARAGLVSQRTGLAASLAEACTELSLADAALLGPALDRLDKCQLLEAERSSSVRDLIEIADGFDEAALRADQSEIDPDLLRGEIDRLGLHQSALLKAIGEASAKFSQARRDYDALAQGRDANGAARERAEASAELLLIAERWVVRAAAARLAARAIERHRAAVQDPLIVRAGGLFRLATSDAFSGLAADYDNADRPVLVTVRSSGARVPISGLSEGTRDQLFLALRLALLELRRAEPLPFIADDLLTSFDEPRTKRVLELLSNVGQHRQVIVFTHHQHVAELAEAAVRQIEIIRL